MNETKRIEFTQDRTVEDHEGHVTAEFKAGRQYTLPVASADHWIRRNVAFDVKAKPEDAEPTTGESAEKAKAAVAKGGK